jgi:hypothetical protein
MRQAILAAVLGFSCAHSAAQAGEWGAPAGEWAVPGSGVRGVAVRPSYGNPYGWGGYGRQLRGGFGVNGYAPWKGPVWGPAAFAHANGWAPDPRPHGSYTRPLYPPLGYVAPETVAPGTVTPKTTEETPMPE